MQRLRPLPSGDGPLVLMLALTAGSVWSVVIGWTDSAAGWMAIPVAGVIACLPAWLGAQAPRRRSRILVTLRNIVLLSMATAYAQYLGAAGVVGQGLGLDFLRTLREIGPGFAFALARQRASTIDWIALAIAVAGLIVHARLLRSGDRRRQPTGG